MAETNIFIDCRFEATIEPIGYDLTGCLARLPDGHPCGTRISTWIEIPLPNTVDGKHRWCVCRGHAELFTRFPSPWWISAYQNEDRPVLAFALHPKANTKDIE